MAKRQQFYVNEFVHITQSGGGGAGPTLYQIADVNNNTHECYIREVMGDGGRGARQRWDTSLLVRAPGEPAVRGELYVPRVRA